MADGTDGPQDPASADKTGTSTVTMTEAELDARDTKTASDALAGAGRTAADLQVREDALKADREQHEAEVGESRKRQHAREDTAAADDPSVLATLRVTRQREADAEELRRGQAALADSTRKLEARRTLTDTELRQTLAEQYEVEPAVLDRLGVGLSREDVTDLAKRLSTKTEPPLDGAPAPIHADSARTTGGGEKSLTELIAVDTRGMSVDQLKEHEKAFDAATKGRS